jgi:hypothetical protein
LGRVSACMPRMDSPAAAAGVLAAGPAQRRVEIVATVHEHGAGFDPVADGSALAASGVQSDAVRPKLAVVHQRDGFLVVLDLHDADDRAEAFIAHDTHVVGHVGEDLRRQIGPAIVCRELSMCATAPSASASETLRAHLLCETHIGHRADGGFLVERIAELHVAIDPGDGLFDEGIIQAFVHIDALDAAAALAGIEHGPVHQRVDGLVEIRIGHDIAGVLAAQLGRPPE